VGERGPLPREGAQRRGGVGSDSGLVKIDSSSEVVEVPEPPEGLKPQSVAIWEGFFRSGVARVVDIGSDMGVLRRWIQAVDEYETHLAVLKEEGPTVIGSAGTPVLSPTARYVAQLEGQIGRLEKELGLTPMARARLGLAIAEAELTAEQINAMAASRGAVSGGGDGDDDLIDVEGWEDA